MRAVSVAFVLFVHAAAVGAASAADPDAAKGIVVEHCTGCHDVPGYSPQGGLATVEAPGFGEIARDRATYPAERLRASLRQPHWPMTQFRLSPSDIENLVAFIEGLAKP